MSLPILLLANSGLMNTKDFNALVTRHLLIEENSYFHSNKLKTCQRSTNVDT